MVNNVYNYIKTLDIVKPYLNINKVPKITKLHEHQKSAINNFKILLEQGYKSGLLYHCIGAGKTLTVLCINMY